MPAEPSEDDGNAGHLAMLGTKLLQGGRTKDALMKLLKVQTINGTRCS